MRRRLGGDAHFASVTHDQLNEVDSLLIRGFRGFAVNEQPGTLFADERIEASSARDEGI
jgi:hypothetical protein